ncbi:MAG TPA: helix-hairpin-helix domain-containing protein [Zeimonas sp.]
MSAGPQRGPQAARGAFVASRAAAVALRRAIVALWLVASVLLGSLAGESHALDANTASIDELQTIRGIGPAMAARIVEARRSEPFRDAEDLRGRVRGIGEKNLRKMQDAGLEVGGGGRMVEAPGQARVLGPAAGQRGAGAARVEHYVGRPR